MAASGQNRSSHQRYAMLGSGLPACGAGLSELGVRAGMTQRELAFSARHGRRESVRGRMRVLVLRDISHSTGMDKITISFGSPFGSLTIMSRITACLWPAQTVGAGGFEPPAHRL
jgi:hypothetical protein